MISRRFSVPTGLALLLVLVWSVRLLPWDDVHSYPGSAWNAAKETLGKTAGAAAAASGWSGRLPADTPHVRNYFEQAFALPPPPDYPFDELRAACAAADWDHNEAYLNCVAIEAGMTSIMSQIKVCFKMAVETGSHLVLPRMPLRDSHNLLDFNFLNSDAYMPYDQWYDADHLRAQLQRACPRMKIVHPDDVGPGKAVAERHHFQILCSDAPFYEKFHSYFWVGRPFKAFFNQQFRLHMDQIDADAAANPAAAAAAAALPADGITVVDVDSEFLLFRLTDDPTRRDVRLWSELSHLIRFRDDVRSVVQALVAHLPAAGNYMAVHFRAENDSIWSPPEHQLAVDLDALDRAWALMARSPDEPKPPVYLACGDPVQVDMFAAAAEARGWATTNKWKIAADHNDADTTARIHALAFDFQGAVDMGLLLRGRFFLGVQGSALSSTVANHRDPTGRYRGSSFEYPDDGARTHLFNDLDAAEYACCL